MKAMILSAGLGTRLKPWTDKHPKALALVNGKSLLQRNVEWLQQYGIKEVIVNVHHFADQITDAISKNNGWGSNITVSDETDQVLETGGGLKKAAWYFNTAGAFLLMNVDILTDLDLSEMIRNHEQYKPLATIAVRERNTSRYFLFDNKGHLAGWENVMTGEKKMARADRVLVQKAFSGIHLIDPVIFSLLSQDGKFSMVDVYLALAKQYDIKAYDHTASKFVDVGKPESVLKAEALFS